MLTSWIILQFDREHNEKQFMFMETSNPQYAAEPTGNINGRHLPLAAAGSLTAAEKGCFCNCISHM
jgi:hypothetical protein